MRQSFVSLFAMMLFAAATHPASAQEQVLGNPTARDGVTAGEAAEIVVILTQSTGKGEPFDTPIWTSYRNCDPLQSSVQSGVSAMREFKNESFYRLYEIPME